MLTGSLIGLAPVDTSAGGTGNVTGPASGPRLAIGGLSGDQAAGGGFIAVGPVSTPAGIAGEGSVLDAAAASVPGATIDDPSALAGPTTDVQLSGPRDGSGLAQSAESIDAVPSTEAGVQTAPDDGSANAAPVGGPFLADGTLLKPMAVNTTARDARSLLTTYKVRKGDTLTTIASRFKVSMMSVWWANDLASKDSLKVGQAVLVPPVSGLNFTSCAMARQSIRWRRRLASSPRRSCR